MTQRTWRQRRIEAMMLATVIFFTLGGSAGAEWPILNWMEKPSPHGPSAAAKPEERVEFAPLFSFDGDNQATGWPELRQQLREGDLIAFWKNPAEARKEIFLRGKLNVIGYRLFKYGHVAMVVKDPRDPSGLRLLSSWSFRGPNVQDDLDTLGAHSWDSYRMNRWDRVDKKRFYEFIDVVRDKAEKWYGYDFVGMFGLVNSNLAPKTPAAIGHSYICSTVIVAALEYAGVELDAYRRFGLGDIVTPLQLVLSAGRIAPSADEADAAEEAPSDL
jgi:hypothetical protein